MFRETETSRVNQIIQRGRMTELEFFALEINGWKKSETRKMQILGDRYYEGKHDILDRKRTVIGESGRLEEVHNLPNNKKVDNQYAKMVDQKVNYLVGKPFTIDSDDKGYADLLKGVFNNQFRKTLKYICEDSLNGAVGWLFICYDEKGELAFRRFPAYEILPFWKDDSRTALDCAVRLYLQEVWEGLSKKTVERVEIFKADGIYRYVLDGFNLVPDSELGVHSPYITVADGGESTAYNWDRIPMIAWRYNKKEIPLIQRTKSLQDGINTMLSDFENNMQEDARNTILVIENYDGENLGEFRRNLAAYGAVKVRSDGSTRGGVNTLTVEVNAGNYKSILEVFKRALIENARGYDATDLRSSGAPNQMNIKSIFNDIDLDANGMETEFQAAFEELIWFINQVFATKNHGDFANSDVSIVFNRDGIVSESEVITDIRNSVGILSEETLVAQHPYVSNVDDELARIKKEREESAVGDYTNGFNPSVPSGEGE